MYIERQNAFGLSGEVATVGGRPDVIAVPAGSANAYDVKTGRPKTSDHVQLMVYVVRGPIGVSSVQRRGVTGAAF